MKKFIKENWFKLILVVLAFLFVWLSEIRPILIKKECVSRMGGFGIYGNLLTGGGRSYSERINDCYKQKSL